MSRIQGEIMQWIYKGNPVKELPKDIVGFVYKIYYTNGTQYIGKKLVRSERKAKPLKGMRKNARRVIERETEWREYEGSSEETKGLEIHSKVILHLCTSKRTMTYLEEKELFNVDAPSNPSFRNKTIGKRYFDNCLDGLYEGDINTRSLFDEE
jgi:intein/homing endonuclease